MGGAFSLLQLFTEAALGRSCKCYNYCMTPSAASTIYFWFLHRTQLRAREQASVILTVCMHADWWVGSCNLVSNTASFSNSNAVFPRTFFVALKLLISFISCIVACSMRIVVNRQTDRQTETHTQTKYHNPRCVCTPRGKNRSKSSESYAGL